MYYYCSHLEYELAEFSRQAPQFQLNLLLQSAAFKRKHPEDEGSRFLKKVGKQQPDYMTLQPQDTSS
jgi:hypothetical protein